MGLLVFETKWSTNREEDNFYVYNPVNGEPCALVKGCGEEQVKACVEAADKAFHETWPCLSPHERGKYLKKAAVALREHFDEIAELETMEVGKTIQVSRADTRRCCEAFEFFGGIIGNIPSDMYELGPINADVFMEPYGVVAGIVPFNWPPLHAGAKIAPALAAGNTVVMKPGKIAPLAVMKIVEIVQSVLPEHVLELVVGAGDIGQALSANKLVRKVSFTGSDGAGRAILKQVADNLTPCIMELGGKNAFIIMENSDLDKAADVAFEGAFFNNGEACTAASRILIQRSVYDKVIAKIIRNMDKLKVGDGMDPAVSIGPMVSLKQKEKVLKYIKIGEEEGAVIAKQVPVPTDEKYKNGYFVPPTFFIDGNREMRIAREEIFGPVTLAIPFDTEEEAISIANDTDFGLIAVVFCDDYPQAMRITRKLDTGCVYINNFYRLGAQCVPFGGNKASGYGRERCAETIKEFCRPKSVRVPSGMGEIPLWIDQI